MQRAEVLAAAHEKNLNGLSLSNQEKMALAEEARLLQPRGPGHPLDDQGGPDAFGYAFVDNLGGDTATYDWIELRGDADATWITGWQSYDDGCASAAAPIGFDFPFYGASYQNFTPTSNGMIEFGTCSASSYYSCIPQTIWGAAVMPCAYDMHLQRGGDATGNDVVAYKNFGTYTVIEYDSIGFFNSTYTGSSMKFEVILFNSGRIKIQYNTVTLAGGAIMGTVGIQNAATTTNLPYRCYTDGNTVRPLEAERAIWFALPDGLPNPVTNLQGSVNGANVTLTWVDPNHDTNGNPLTPDSILIYRGNSQPGSQIGHVAAGAQTFSVTESQGNITYYVRAKAGTWLSGPVSRTVVVGTPGYANDFDVDNGGWTSDGGWSWGAPTNATAPQPHSGSNMWGTGMDANYTGNQCNHLDLDPGLAVTSNNATVEFWAWWSMYPWGPYDGVNFKVSVDGGVTWENVQPSPSYFTQPIYTFNTCTGVSGDSAWTEAGANWQYVVIPIGQYLGQTPMFRFTFGSYLSGYPGFFFDDMTIWGIATPPDGIPRSVTNFQGTSNRNTVTLTWTDPDHDTNNNPFTPDSVVIFRGNLQPGSQIGHVAPGAQTISLPSQPVGPNTYYARAKAGTYLSSAASTSFWVGDSLWREADYDWVDITTDGTVAAQGDDFNDGPFDLGFTFTYFGNPYTQVRICSNGFITFGDQNNTLGAPCPLNTAAPNNVVYVFNTDLYPTAGQCKYYADAANGRFIVSWDNCPHFSQGGPYNFQVILEPSGSIKMQYGEMADVNAVLGVENATGTAGTNLWCHTAGSFTPGGGNAVEFWGGDLIYGPVSGHVTLSGGHGSVAAVTVTANGQFSPNTHPNAGGDYTISLVQIGNRRITGTLAGYDPTPITIVIPDSTGYTGANITMRRSAPPAPASLTGTVITARNVDSLHWAMSPDTMVDGYKLYRKLTTDGAFTFRYNIWGRTTQYVLDTLTVAGVYNYVITAVDTNMLAPPWCESMLSDTVTNPYGHLAPINLTADGAFDSHIHLAWNSPTDVLASNLMYDNGVNEVEGIGWWGATPPYGWMVARYPGTAPQTVTAIRAYLTRLATPGTPFELGVFADDGTGHPSFTPLATIHATVEEPLNAMHEYTLDAPVTVDKGTFYVGIRQTTGHSVCLGGEMQTPFITNTFFYSYDGQSWNAWEPELLSVPMLSAHVTAAVESGITVRSDVAVSRAPMAARKTETVKGFLAKTPASVRALTAPAAAKVAAPGLALGVSATTDKKDQYSHTPDETRAPFSHPAWQVAQRMNSAVGPHAPIARAAESSSRGRGGRMLDEITRYLVFRDNEPDAIDSTLPGVLTYDNTGVAENQNHTYMIKARYDDNLLSPPSNSVTMMCNMAPDAPTNVLVEASGTTGMHITWADPAVNVDGSPCTDLAGIRIYRDGTLITPTPVAPGVHSYIDTPPDPMTIYTWTVKGIDEVPNEGPGADGSGSVVSPWHSVELQWVDITTNGTVAAQGDDIMSGPYDLGFAFPYYGQTYNQVNVCSNGFITFGDQSVTLYPPCIPSTFTPNGVVFAFATDLFPTSGQCKYYADAANQRFIVSWDNCPHYGGSPNFNFQIILDANGGVTLNYGTMGNTNAVIGVENADGSDGVSLRCTDTGPFTPGDNAVQFWGGPRQAINGTLRHLGGSNPALIGAQVWATGGVDTVLTDANGAYQLPVDPGTYTVHYRHATHCDSVRTGVVVEANVNTTIDLSLRSPNATLSVSSLTFVVRRFQTQPQTFSITNAGGNCPLSFQVLDSVNWLSSDPASGTVDPNQSATITVTASPGTMQPNEYHTTMRVLCNAPGSPFLVQVDMNVLSVDQLPGLLPTEFALHANYPNPFNPTTLLPFDVPQNSQVNIIVYNVMGQEVATLVNGKYAAGRYQVSFDAGNLPSGLYLVKMTAGNYTAMNKMMLLK
ncbi:MAG TPA: carboxypeptidase regulatory-like domain-containing protein [bacterium]